MVNRYAVEAVKGRTNYMDGRVSGPVIVDALLDRSTITVTAKNTVGYKGKVLGMPSLTFAVNPSIDTVNNGDYYVQLDVSTAATYEACEGRPIVSKVAGTGGVAGTLLTLGNTLMVTPSTTPVDTVATRIAGKYLAVEAVKLYGYEYMPVKVNGTAGGDTGGPILVGSPLQYDVSREAYILAGSGTAVISCHYAAADDLYVGALFGPRIAVSQA
jgi:hypothetical protein